MFVRVTSQQNVEGEITGTNNSDSYQKYNTCRLCIGPRTSNLHQCRHFLITSASFLAEISVSSPRKLVIFII